MCRVHLLSCVALALTLVFLADGAPTSGSGRDARQKLVDIKEDLEKLLKGVNNYKNPEHARMLTFKFYIPRKVTELNHLLCLKEELKALKDVLNLSQRKNFPLEEMVRSVENINVTVNALAETAAEAPCEFDEEGLTSVEFLSKWVTFCQSLFSALT